MNRAFLVALLALAQCGHAANWRNELSPDSAGSLAPVRPFEAVYRFGWSDIEAARATARVMHEGKTFSLDGFGATTGLARLLWQLDVTHHARSALPDFRTIDARQEEIYAKRSIITQIVQKPDGFWRLRETGGPAKWKEIKLSPIRDLFSSMLFLRSQNLEPGASAATVVFPGDSPFLVRMSCVRREPIVIAGTSRPALRFTIELQRINMKEGERLEKHPKFQRGQVWLSDDADRIPLRAEVDIFIGYVFAELESLKFL